MIVRPDGADSRSGAVLSGADLRRAAPAVLSSLGVWTLLMSYPLLFLTHAFYLRRAMPPASRWDEQLTGWGVYPIGLPPRIDYHLSVGPIDSEVVMELWWTPPTIAFWLGCALLLAGLIAAILARRRIAAASD